jgi:hypothetical protein
MLVRYFLKCYHPFSGVQGIFSIFKRPFPNGSARAAVTSAVSAVSAGAAATLGSFFSPGPLDIYGLPSGYVKIAIEHGHL